MIRTTSRPLGHPRVEIPSKVKATESAEDDSFVESTAQSSSASVAEAAVADDDDSASPSVAEAAGSESEDEAMTDPIPRREVPESDYDENDLRVYNTIKPQIPIAKQKPPKAVEVDQSPSIDGLQDDQENQKLLDSQLQSSTQDIEMEEESAEIDLDADMEDDLASSPPPEPSKEQDFQPAMNCQMM